MSIRHTVYFVRHGQCQGNVSGETLPPEKDVITDYGRKQAAALGVHLKHIQFTRSYASTYERAIETAKGILAESTDPCPVPLKMDSRIKEREMGEMVGKSAKEVVMRTIMQLEEGKKFNQIEIPGAETQAEYVGRMRSFFKELFDDLKKSGKEETVLIVSHGLFMRRFLVGLNDSTFEDVCTVTNWTQKCASALDNTACTIFTLDYKPAEDKPVITFDKIHCRDHLRPLIEAEAASNNNQTPKSTFNITPEQKKQLMEKVLQIPGAKEELSGCVQV